MANGGRIRIDGVRILDVTAGRLSASTSIAIESGCIAGMGSEASLDDSTVLRIDGTGLTAVPGLINLHVHLCLDASLDPVGRLLASDDEEVLVAMEEGALETLRGGITTVRDLGCRGGLIFELRRRIEESRCPGPRIVAAGQALTRRGGHGAGWIGFECDGQDGVRIGARQQLEAGADVLKVMATGGVMSLGTSPYLATYAEEEIRAVVEEGRRENVSVAAHAEGREGIELAVQVGVSTVEHGTYMDEVLAAKMIDQGTAWVPTISPHRFAERARSAGRVPPVEERVPVRSTLERGRTPLTRNITAAALSHFERHCRIHDLSLGLGSDAGTPLVPHDDLVTEMEMFVEQGYGLSEVLRMASLGNAEILRLDHLLGSIEPGKLADVLLVEGNPLETLDAIRHIKHVLKGGDLVFSAAG